MKYLVLLLLVGCASNGISNKELDEERKRIEELESYVNNEVIYERENCVAMKLCNSRELFIVCGKEEKATTKCVEPSKLEKLIP